jgi:hypothetical protein
MVCFGTSPEFITEFPLVDLVIIIFALIGAFGVTMWISQSFRED